ncbi:MAG: nickel pincer cofactor biosynthesis protein LarB [Anaerolineae bacterium]
MTTSPDHNSTDLNRAPFARPDFDRIRRKGVPEVILAASKTVPQCMQIAESFVERTGRAILSRVSPELHAELAKTYGDTGFEWYAASRTAILRTESCNTPSTGGRVGILTAGTSDQAIAEEAAIVCREMGCTVGTAYDVGVAGLHRLFEPLENLLARDAVDVIIVAAGMDGALPSVVSGLVDVPVIGLPTSVGYGMGGQGHAALLAMLQTCSPGLAVVNIDNGVGAGAMAGIIANRAAAARQSAPAQE